MVGFYPNQGGIHRARARESGGGKGYMGNIL